MKKTLAEELRSYANIVTNEADSSPLTVKSLEEYRYFGSSLQGYVRTDFKTLTELLGPSLGPSDDGKITQEWLLEFSDGVMATIYDWKERSTPMGPYDWHVGGKKSDLVVGRVEAVLRGSIPVVK